MRTRTAALFVLAVTLAACGQAEDGSTRLATANADTAADGKPSASAVGGTAYEDPRAPLCSTLERQAAVTGPLSSDPAVAAAQQWRADMGLRSDAAWVVQVNRGPRDLTFAHNVTPEEHADLMSRTGPGPEVGKKINDYTQRFPDTFAGLWTDQSAHGRITVAFTADVDARRRELDALLGDGVPHAVVVGRTSRAELRRLSDEFGDWNRDGKVLADGWGGKDDIGVLEIDLYVRDEPSVRAVADRFEGRPICIEGADPKDIIPDGPQPIEGDGWRLLADAATKGEPYSVSAAQDQAAYEQLWVKLRLDGEPPAVDFDRELVLHFGPAVSGSCAHIRLDGIVVDDEHGIVYPQVVRPGVQPRACTSDARPHTYLVAMQRDSLPEDFTLRVNKEVPPNGVGGIADVKTPVHQSH
jgi:hypothetical protein